MENNNYGEQTLYLDTIKDEIDKIQKKGGFIEVAPLIPNKFESFSFRMYRDKKGVYFGIPIGKDKDTGRAVFKKINLSGHRQYNTELKDDLLEAIIVKNHPYCLGSPNAKGKPMWKVVDTEKDAETDLVKFKSASKALDIALELEGDELVDFARMMGVSPDTNSITVVQKMLAEKAQKNPKEFLDFWNSDTREVVQVFERAKATGLITFSSDAGFVYKDGERFGMTQQAVVATLLGNKSLMNVIHIESSRLSEANTNVGEGDVKRFDVDEETGKITDVSDMPIVEDTPEVEVEVDASVVKEAEAVTTVKPAAKPVSKPKPQKAQAPSEGVSGKENKTEDQKNPAPELEEADDGITG